ncbi:MAG: hypothetical protein MK135_10675, partial [Polyangiaceae bacterium]|nr:hypothetical protein [Polyangiaceae bacterium]
MSKTLLGTLGIGTLGPLALAVLNRAGSDVLGNDFLYASLARLCLPRPVFVYLLLGAGVFAVQLWLLFYREHPERNP